MTIEFILGAIVFTISFTPIKSSLICDAINRMGGSCTACDFLTFRQEVTSTGYTNFCPNGINTNYTIAKYCCYDLLRRPICCDGTMYIITGLIWLALVVAIICVIYKFVRSIFQLVF